MFSINLFKSLADNSPDITAILDRNLTYLYINPVITKYTGLLPEEIIGRDIHFSYRSEENVKKIITQIDTAITTKKITELELKVNTVKGQGYFNLRISAVFDENDILNNVFIFSRDITEHKLHQKELRTQQKDIITSAEALLQPLVILSPVYENQSLNDFKCEYANKASAISGKISREDILGRKLCDLFPLFRKNKVCDNLKKVFTTGRPWREVITYDDPSGENIIYGIFEISAARIDTGLVITWNDITHLKITEDRLSKSENKFNLAFNSSPAAMVISKAQGIIVDVNKAYESLFGWSREELIGRDSRENGIFIEQRDVELLSKILNKDGILKNQEFNLITKNRDIVNVLLSVVKYDIDGEPYYFSVIVDLTDQRKLELSLQDSLREKVILLQEVHHRVRNNMQIILSMLNLQRNSITNNLINDQLLAVQNRIRSMALVYDKLFPSDSYSTINLRHYLSALVNNTADSLFTPETHLTFDIPDDFSINIESAIKIGLIINELFSNSFKHEFPDISQGKINLNISKKNKNNLLLHYCDNGPELPEYLNLDNPESLGLKLINILVDDLNGTIEYTRLNKSSNFNILLNVISY